MADFWQALLRRARLRGLTEGQVQTVRAESLDDDAKDAAERFQDYGFAAHPGDGQGLVLHLGGHTIVLRMDRLAERPALARHEVTVWHADGHRVTLKAGQVVQVDCAEFIVNASGRVVFNAPEVRASDQILAPEVSAGTSLKVQGKEMHLHVHGLVEPGTGESGPPD